MRRFKIQEEIEEEKRAASAVQTSYPTHKKLLIYARQSNKKQVTKNKESAAMQTIKLRELALQYGWQECDTTVYIENIYNKYGELTEEIRSASGNLSIDERGGLKIIVQRIVEGSVGAIMVWDVDRLTRDEDEIDGAVLVNLCKEYYVLIITPYDEFDFNNPRRDDRQRFLDLAREAVNHTRKHVKARMLPAKREKAMRGEFFGHNIPTGFMLDDTREHYIDNPLWAPVIKRLFKRFHELDANSALLYREIVGKPIFRELPEEMKERIGHISLARVQGGYTIKNRATLKYMLTNVAYIGHIAYDGQIVKHNAHTAIVDADDFWFAYNALADTDLDGNTIEREKRVVFYQQQSEQGRCEGLMEGTRVNGRPVINSTGKGRAVHVMQHAKGAAYRISDFARIALSRYVASINVNELDAIVAERLLYRMTSFSIIDVESSFFATRESEIYEQFKAVQQAVDTPMSATNYTIDETKGAIARLDREYEVTFDIMTNQEIRNNRESKARLVRQLGDLEHKQEKDAATEQDMREVAAILASGTIAEQWEAMKFAKKQKFIRLVTESIVLDEIADDWFTLTLVWSRHLGFYEIDTAYIWQRQGTGNAWTDEEKQLLRDYYGTASRAWILEQLPSRTWDCIKTRACKIGLSRQHQHNDSVLPDWISIDDAHVMDEHRLELDQADKCVWWKEGATINRDSPS